MKDVRLFLDDAQIFSMLAPGEVYLRYNNKGDICENLSKIKRLVASEDGFIIHEIEDNETLHPVLTGNRTKKKKKHANNLPNLLYYTNYLHKSSSKQRYDKV